MKYVIYYRVSTKKQGDSGLGLEAQKAYINTFLDDDDVVCSFTEVKSGKSIQERPVLKQALEYCAKNNCGLAVAKIDRLSRNTEDALSIYNELNGYLFSCDIPTQKGQPMDKFTLTIYMAIADRERELISIRTKAALKEKKRRGEHLGKPEFMTVEGREKAWASNRKKANQNPNNRRVMEMIALLKKEGLTLQAIADRLNETGHVPPSGGKYAKFHKTTIARLHQRYRSIQNG